MKKFVLLMFLISAVVLSACGGDSNAPEATDTPETTVEPEATEEASSSTIDPNAIVMPVSDISARAQAELPESGTPQEFCEAAVPAEEPETREYEQAEQVIEEGVDYRAIFCTSAGAVYIDLLEEYAPVTVNSFVFLAENDFYNNTIFHRVIQDFMAQGGDPTGTGRGGPGYSFPDEFVGFLTFDRPGWLAMANSGPATNGSQFFITTAPTTHLDFAHTIFGEVLEGQDMVESIQLRDPESGGDATTLDTVLIISDPERVVTTFEPREAASQEEILSALTELETALGAPGIAMDVSEEPIDTETVVSEAPEAQQEDYQALLTEANHSYRVLSDVANENCDIESFPFLSLSYTLDVFESTEDASSVLASDVLDEIITAEGYTASEESDSLYTRTVEGCNGEDATQGLKIVQRGRYLATLTGAVPVGFQFPVEVIVDQIAGLAHERFLSDILRRELR